MTDAWNMKESWEKKHGKQQDVVAPRTTAITTTYISSSFDKHLLSSFFTMLLLAMVFVIIAFILYSVFTDSTRTMAENLVRQRQNPTLEAFERRFLNIHDTIAYYDRLVRN